MLTSRTFIRILALAGLLALPRGAIALAQSVPAEDGVLEGLSLAAEAGRGAATPESAAASIGRSFDKTGSFPAPPVSVIERTYTTPDPKREVPSLTVGDVGPASDRTPPPSPEVTKPRKGFGSHLWKAVRFPFVGLAGGAVVGAAYGAGKGYSLVKGTRGVSKVTGVLGGVVGFVVGAVGGLLAGLWGAVKSIKDAVVDLFHGEL
ncbi:hypothetical protein ACFL2T_03935 [Elusimicrobiota bacterium]